MIAIPRLAAAHPARLYVSTAHWRQMRLHVAALAPLEACGLLAGAWQGDSMEITAVLPVPNALASPVRYRMDPAAQLAAMTAIETAGWQIAGIFHSHPQGPDMPSDTDIAEAYYPEAAHLIWSHRTGAWRCRAFWIEMGQVQKTRLAVHS